MTLEPVSCNHCGAPIEVPAGAKFATCAHCGSRLAIKRTASAAYTEVLDQIGQHTERMSENLEVIRLQNELERLDREWTMQRDSLLVRGKDGSASPPSAAGGVIGGMVMAAFGVFWTVTAGSIGAPGFFQLFGLMFVGVAIFAACSSVTGAQKYGTAEQEYQQRRAELLRQLDQNRRQ